MTVGNAFLLIVCAGLLIYLLYALLKAERF